MKMIAALLTIGCLQISAKGLSQKITLNEKDAPLEKIFSDIKAQSGYLFFYDVAILQKSQPVSVAIKNASLEDALQVCFKDQPLSYVISHKIIIVNLKSDQGQESPPPSQITVQGKIMNEKGEPLAGAIIRIKDSNLGAVTDDRGGFTLVNVSPNATLIITNIGYEPKEIKLNGQQNLHISLKVKNNPLDQVQVIAYGTTTQRLATGNVTTITSKEIEKQPVTNALLALEGRVPGLFITQSTGYPGSGVTVRVEGQNSIANGNDPLYVIDGVPYTSQILSTVGGGGILGGNEQANGYGGGGGDSNPLNLIDPADIESITVLKDADATAIYGSRAANGAILITTKKGAPGKTKITANFQNGWGHIDKTIPLLNTQQYLMMRHEAFKNDGLTPGPGDYDINGTWDTTRNTDWQKALIGGTSQYTNATVGLSGGSTITQYFVNGTYHRETDVVPGHYADQSGAVNFNLNTSTADKKFKFQLSGNYLVDNNQLPGNDVTRDATMLAPDAPPLYNKDGTLNWQYNAAGSFTFLNPLSYMYNYDSRKTNNLVSHALVNWEILPGLEIRSSFGYTNQQASQVFTHPILFPQPETMAQPIVFSTYGTSNINSWIIEPQISYNKSIGKGRLEALAGATIEKNSSDGQSLFGMGYNSPLLMQNVGAAASLSGGSVVSIYRYNAAFGRLNYVYNEKYIVDLTARRDGSSRFGSANEFHNFGAVGLGWIFTGENFVRDNLSFLSFGKLTASFGTTGNDQIGDYQFRTLYNTYTTQVPYQGITGLLPNGLSNPYLQWESTNKLYFSLNLGFLKDRILFNAGYTDNHTSNQLLNYALPFVTGFYGVARNLPATVQNTSWEFTLKTLNFTSGNFNWTSNINLTIPRNRLVAFPNFANSGYQYAYTIGRSVSGFKVYHLLGIDPATGMFQFLGADGKPTFNPNPMTDSYAQVDFSPKFYGGFENNFSYKGFELDVLFQFVKQDGRTDPFGDLPGYWGGSGDSNQPVWVLNRWQKPGDKATNPLFSTYVNGNLVNSWFNGSGSDAAFGDASFIRVKNVSLSWQIPEQLVKKAHLQNCQVYVHAQNLLTITKFRGLDPESQVIGTALPPLRVVTVGLQLGL